MFHTIEAWDGHSIEFQEELIKAAELLGYKCMGHIDYDLNKGFKLVFVIEDGIENSYGIVHLHNIIDGNDEVLFDKDLELFRLIEDDEQVDYDEKLWMTVSL